MRKIYFIVFYCLVLITPNILSQTAYIVDNRFFVKPSPYYFLQDSIFQNYQYIDTNVLHFQNSLPFYFNGQIGTAQPDYLLQHQSAQIGSRVLSIYYPDVLQKRRYKHLSHQRFLCTIRRHCRKQGRTAF